MAIYRGQGQYVAGQYNYDLDNIDFENEMLRRETVNGKFRFTKAELSEEQKAALAEKLENAEITFEKPEGKHSKAKKPPSKESQTKNCKRKSHSVKGWLWYYIKVIYEVSACAEMK